MWKLCKNFFFCQVSSTPGSSSCCSASCSCSDSLSAGTHQEFKLEDFVVKKDTILRSSHSLYLVKEFTGEGKFGRVAKCVNLQTSQDVTVKILKTKNSKNECHEIGILKKVSALDPIKKNVIQFLDHFKHRGHICLTFETLDRTLVQLLTENKKGALSLTEIRPIAQQLVTALDALKGIGIIHTDLKPDNIMLINHVDHPFRIKVIDFGLALSTSRLQSGVTVQPLGYRAPEVSLGLHISEAIDMWSLGCVLLLLCLGIHPFSTNGEYKMIRDIVSTLGQPPDHLLDAGNFTHRFFKKNELWHRPKWWLKTPREYQLDTGILPTRRQPPFMSLNSLIKAYPEDQESIELEDERAFISLLGCILEMDPEKRITPEEALKHPFISMAHMEAQRDTSMYVFESLDLMSVIPHDGEELPPADDSD